MKNTKNKKICLIMMIVIMMTTCLFFLYQTIGYLIRGLNGAYLIGDNNGYFIGNHILSLVYGLIFIIVVIISVVLFFKIKKRL